MAKEILQTTVSNSFSKNLFHSGAEGTRFKRRSADKRVLTAHSRNPSVSCLLLVNDGFLGRADRHLAYGIERVLTTFIKTTYDNSLDSPRFAHKIRPVYDWLQEIIDYKKD